MSRAAALGAPILLLLATGAWILGGWEPALGDSERSFYWDILSPFFVPDARDPAMYRANRRGAAQVYFAREKPAGVFRVFVVGDSAAANYMLRAGQGGLQAALQAALPSPRVEAINCAMGGYDSHREGLVVDEILGYSPDLVVVMTTGRGEGARLRPLPGWRLRAESLLTRLAAFRGLRRVLSLRDVVPGRSEEADDAVFTGNLRSMIRSAKAKGVALAVCAVPLNYGELQDWNPRPYADEDFLAGWLPYLKGDFRGARKAWNAVLPRLISIPSEAMPPGRKSAILFHLGLCAERLGLREISADFLAQALDADPHGAGPARMALMRDVARRQGAIWIDLDAAFRRQAYPGLPGLDMFSDGSHWLGTWDGLVSSEVVRALRGCEAFRELPWDKTDLRLGALRRGRRPAGKGERLATLRRALSLIGGSRPALSLQAVIDLDYLDRNGIVDIDDLSGLLRLAGPAARVRGGAGGQSLHARLLWHRGEVELRRKRYRAAHLDFLEALKEDASLYPVAASDALACALSGDDGGFQAAVGRLERDGLREEAEALRQAASRQERGASDGRR